MALSSIFDKIKSIFAPPLCAPVRPDFEPYLGSKQIGQTLRAEHGGKDGPYITNFHCVTKETGEETTRRGTWGGNQNRLVCDGETTYFAYLTKGEYGAYEKEFSLYSLQGGAWKLLGSDKCTGDAVIPLLDKNGHVFVASADDNGESGAKHTYCIWEYVPGMEGLCRHIFEGEAGLFDYNYYAACIDRENSTIYMLFCGAAAPGVLAYNTFDTKTKSFGTPRSFETDYRHCYIYMDADKDKGLILQGTRDTIGTLMGYAPLPKGVFAYAFDGVRYWHIKDTAGGVPDTELPIWEENAADYPGETNYPSVVNNSCGDCFTDNLGRTHILYKMDTKSTKRQPHTYHAIVENGVLTKNDLLWERTGSMRLIQDGKGTYWLLFMAYDGIELCLYRGDVMGENFTLWATFRLPDNATLSYAGLYLAAPRGGTTIDDFVDIVYPTGEDVWHYFRLHLCRIK